MRSFKNNKLPNLTANSVLGMKTKYVVFDSLNQNEPYVLTDKQIEDNEDWDEVKPDWTELDPKINN